MMRLESFHDKRDTYNCSIDYYIANKSHAFLIGHLYSYILLWSSFFLTTFGQDLKTYDAGMSFITSSKDVNNNELYGLFKRQE